MTKKGVARIEIEHETYETLRRLYPQFPHRTMAEFFRILHFQLCNPNGVQLGVKPAQVQFETQFPARELTPTQEAEPEMEDEDEDYGAISSM